MTDLTLSLLLGPNSSKAFKDGGRNQDGGYLGFPRSELLSWLHFHWLSKVHLRESQDRAWSGLHLNLSYGTFFLMQISSFSVCLTTSISASNSHHTLSPFLFKGAIWHLESLLHRGIGRHSGHLAPVGASSLAEQTVINDPGNSNDLSLPSMFSSVGVRSLTCSGSSEIRTIHYGKLNIPTLQLERCHT